SGAPGAARSCSVKIQLAEVDLLKAWPSITLRQGYYAIRILVRLGSIPVGEVMARPRRCGTVAPQRLARRIAHRIMFPLLRQLSRAALSAGPEMIAKHPPLPGRPVGSGQAWKSAARSLLRQLLQPTGLPEPWPQVFQAAEKRDQFECPPIT